jgi:hypothetical protein
MTVFGIQIVAGLIAIIIKSEENQVESVILMFHCVMFMVHVFIFAILMNTYSSLKTGKPLYSTFYPAYYRTIERNRTNLNEGYEVPTGCAGNRQSNYYETRFIPMDKRVYEQPNAPLQRKQNCISYAEIHTAHLKARPQRGLKKEGEYDEIVKASDDPNSYNNLELLR